MQLSVILGSICTTHWEKEVAILSWRWQVCGLHHRLCSVARGLRHIKISAQLCRSIYANCELTQLSHFTDEDVKTQRAKAVYSKSLCDLQCEQFRNWSLGWLVFFTYNASLWSSRILRVTKPWISYAFPDGLISLPYFIWNSIWLKALKCRYLSFGQLKVKGPLLFKQPQN